MAGGVVAGSRSWSSGTAAERGWRAAAALLLVVFGGVLVRTAWTCDDAYITFRTIDNVLHGLGPRWNAAERVQAFTHPLWLGVLLAPVSLTREVFLTPLLVSIAVSLGAAALVPFRLAANAFAAAFAMAVLLSSRAFVDYSTSGLENPLTHLLLGAFAAVLLGTGDGTRRPFVIGLLGGLLALNRLDALLLVLPALVVAFAGERTARGQGALLLGFLPVAAWEAFSVVYYGFPFPNTAYAKLGTGIPPGELARQGARYLLDSLARDPVTLPVILLGAVLAVAARERAAIALAFGIALHLVYVVRIGGDFMSGRFLSAPLYLAAAIVASRPPRVGPKVWLPALAGVVALSFVAPYPPVTTGGGFGRPETLEGWIGPSGIGDERRFYFQDAGLLKWRPGRAMPTHPFAEDGRRLARELGRGTVVVGAIGYRGYFAGPALHLIDGYALADPLLARLPAIHTRRWRIGHFGRALPAGYRESAGTERNLLRDPSLARYYDRLRLVVSGPLFSEDRWRAIVDLNLGRLDGLVSGIRYRYPGLAVATAAQLDAAAVPGGEPGTPVTGAAGLLVLLPGPHSGPGAVRIDATPGEGWEALFLRSGEVVARSETRTPGASRSGTALVRIGVPERAGREGFDAVHLLPLDEAATYRLRAFRLE